MKLLSIYRALGPVDVKSVRRDDLLLWTAAVPLFMSLAFRFGVPPLSRFLMDEAGFDLRAYYGLIMSFFVLTAPAMVGMVTGFLLLDERDDRVLAALLVTPMPLSGYLAYRTSLPIVLGFVVTVACYPIAGLAPLPITTLAMIALLAACAAPLTALFLAVFAENKISGFALVKILNTINMIPVAAYFVDMPWQLAAGIVPTYWPAKMVWQASVGDGFAVTLTAGAAINAGWLLFLIRRFGHVVRR